MLLSVAGLLEKDQKVLQNLPLLLDRVGLGDGDQVEVLQKGEVNQGSRTKDGQHVEENVDLGPACRVRLFFRSSRGGGGRGFSSGFRFFFDCNGFLFRLGLTFLLATALLLGLVLCSGGPRRAEGEEARQQKLGLSEFRHHELFLMQEALLPLWAVPYRHQPPKHRTVLAEPLGLFLGQNGDDRDTVVLDGRCALAWRQGSLHRGGAHDRASGKHAKGVAGGLLLCRGVGKGRRG